jgi:O-antigen ligase
MSLLKIAEKGFAIVSLLFFTGAITDLVTEAHGARDPISRLFPYLAQLITVALVICHRRQIVPLLKQRPLLWILLGIALVSVFWSSVPKTSLRNVITLLHMTLFGVYLASRYSLKEQLRLLAWMFGIAAVLSLITAIVWPEYGVMGRGEVVDLESMTHQGAWRGIFIHKNPMGRIMTLGATLFALLVASLPRQQRWGAWIGFSVLVSLILLTTSKTALVVFMTLMLLLPLYRALRWNYTLAVPFFIALVLIGGSTTLLLVGNLEEILGAFGRDLTLTGRTDLWVASLEKITQHPWLGYGLTGFWRGLSGESGDISQQLGWLVPHSHNGFFDLTLDLGLVGLAVFAVGFLASFFHAIAFVRKTRTAEGLLPIVYLTFLVLYNLTESSLLRQTSLWSLYVAITFGMHSVEMSLAKFKPVRFPSVGLPIPPVFDPPYPLTRGEVSSKSSPCC